MFLSFLVFFYESNKFISPKFISIDSNRIVNNNNLYIINQCVGFYNSIPSWFKFFGCINACISLGDQVMEICSLVILLLLSDSNILRTQSVRSFLHVFDIINKYIIKPQCFVIGSAEGAWKSNRIGIHLSLFVIVRLASSD